MKRQKTWGSAIAAVLIIFTGFSETWSQTVIREEKLIISFPNMALPIILGEYEQLTGKRIVRDNAVLGATLSIETQQELTEAEAAEFIEKSLLLNGFALIPNGRDTLKVIAFSDGKQPNSEGVPVITRREQLPENDEVVTYLLPLHNITPAEAEEALSKIFTVHSYGKLVALDSASALSITENAFTIQKMIEVIERFDLPPTEVTHKTLILERADPEEVVEAVKELMGLDQTESESSVPPAPAGALQARSESQRTRQLLSSLPQVREVNPKLKAIPRTNKIMVVGRPSDIALIEILVHEFDGPVQRKKMISRTLNYISVSDVLPIAEHTLLRNLTGENSSGAGIAGGEEKNQATVSTGNIGGTGTSTNSDDIQDLGPQSLIVGKTLIIGDNVQNTIVMSGPSEDLETLNELIDSIDIKPRQILISAVIAQLTLGKDFDYGLDFLRTLQAPGANRGNFNGAGVFRSRTAEGQSLLNIDGLTDFNNFLPAAGGLTLYGQVNPALNSFLSAAENHTRFKVLSRPMIYTLNNRRAEILSGQRIAVPRSQQSVLSPNQVNTNQVVTASIDFEDVLLRIEVIPLINAEDKITLQIAQTNEDIVGNQIIGGDTIPTIGTQALKTTVIVPNGGTILLGGLISEEDSKSKTGAPIMVNIPLVGDVFGSSEIEKERQELMIFIQPKIVDDESDLYRSHTDLSERSMFMDETMEFARPESQVIARPVSPPAKRGLLQRIFQLDKIDSSRETPASRRSAKR